MKLATKFLSMCEAKADFKALKPIAKELLKDSKFDATKDSKAFGKEVLRRAKESGVDTSKMIWPDGMDALG
jgi:hypothetical protein